jgi:TetR/AcrR family transcriptional repressor of nem operon
MSRPAPATDRGQCTRDRIVAAGATLIRERGVANVRLDDVQAAAGVGRSQMYHYFASRDDLIHAVVDATVAMMLERQLPAMACLDNLPAIDAWFENLITLTTARAGVGGCPIGSLVSQLADHDEVSRTSLADAFVRWEAPLLAGLTRMAVRGELRPGASPTDLADAVMATVQGGLLLAQVRRDPDQLRHALAGVRSALVADIS